MHNSRQKKDCPKCSQQISVPNFNKHVVVCKGQVEKKTEWVCEICFKEFSSSQGCAGHKSRTHNQENQRRVGAIGNKRKRQMEAEGHKFTFNMPETAKEKLSLIACERLAKHSKYTRNIEYKPGVILESSYEVRVAEILDKLGVDWERVRQGYIWDDNGKSEDIFQIFIYLIKIFFLTQKMII